MSEQKASNEGLAKQLESCNNAVGDFQKQLESQGVTMQQLEQELTQKSSEVTTKEEENVKVSVI